MFTLDNFLLPLAQAPVTFDPATLGESPAPFWFVQFFKVLGFVLHMIAMNIWFAGLPIAILAFILGMPQARRFAKRLFSQLPIIMALGINFGIVPLLFVQTLYYKTFYSATIFMAWHWILVIPLVMVAYYSLYIAAFSIKSEKKSAQTLLAGLVSTICLLAVAYIFVNAMSLMGRPEHWLTLWEKGQVLGNQDFGAATLGLGINASDSSIWLRYGTMFGLALTTTAFWAVFDANVLIPKRSELSAEQLNADAKYRDWIGTFALLLALLGGVLASSIFAKYTGILKANPVTATLFEKGTLSSYFLYAAIGTPFVPFLAILASKIFRLGPVMTAIKIIVAQLIALGVFAIARQWVQNTEISQIVPITQIKENVQWSPLIVFLVLFVLGAILIGWMLRQIAIAPPAKTE